MTHEDSLPSQSCDCWSWRLHLTIQTWTWQATTLSPTSAPGSRSHKDVIRCSNSWACHSRYVNIWVLADPEVSGKTQPWCRQVLRLHRWSEQSFASFPKIKLLFAIINWVLWLGIEILDTYRVGSTMSSVQPGTLTGYWDFRYPSVGSTMSSVQTCVPSPHWSELPFILGVANV